MVVSEADDADLDRLFRALADATRRDIIVQAANGAQSVSALARRYPISVTAVQKHVAQLEAAGLVHKRRQGREQIVVSRAEQLAVAARALDRLEAQWRARLERFGQVLAESTGERDD